MRFDVGSIVRVRGREWVVLPGSSEKLLHLDPLGGAEVERTKVLTSLEVVESATFPMPSPEAAGDSLSARLLLNAARLGNRNTTGPFRSLSRIAIEPRPYQLVPLLMALRQNPVRMLIADDVGIGKTVEALMIARELMDRGEIKGFCVLCPPHLAEQWQREIKTKFHLDAELYTANAADRLTRNLAAGESPFDRYPVIVASIDFVKQESRRDYFIQRAPELVIVDEAHSCARDPALKSEHLRNYLVEQLSRKKARHLILVTATPHTGKEDAFRNLVSFLDPELADLPEDLRGEQNRRQRERLAQYMIQRRRKDLSSFLEKTYFPIRKTREEPYALMAKQRDLLKEIIGYAQGQYAGTWSTRRRRIVFWSLLSILRALGSSPDAAIATLTTPSVVQGAKTEGEIDKIGERELLEADAEGETEGADIIRGARTPEEERIFDGWAKQIAQFRGAKDPKLAEAKRHIKQLLDDGYDVLVFCQFIPTAKYVADELAKAFSDAAVTAVTGENPPHDRELRIGELRAKNGRRILVATDCLSEGINLQDAFSAVFHYDLSWNPTRHEQRDGRVDRYGQPKPEVRSVTFYGKGNVIDGFILRVLLRKHQSIRSSTGVSVPVPKRSKEVTAAIRETILLKSTKVPDDITELDLSHFGVEDLHKEWEVAGERERGSPTLFAQRTIKDEEVQMELEASRKALGTEAMVSSFVREALRRLGAGVEDRKGRLHIDPGPMKPDAKDALDMREQMVLTFNLDDKGDATYIHRTHPLVESLSDYILETAMDELISSVASRAGVTSTRTVSSASYLFLLRYRYQLTLRSEPRLVEEVRIAAFQGDPTKPRWLEEPEIAALLESRPEENIDTTRKREILGSAVEAYAKLLPELRRLGDARRDEILAAHQRVRSAAQLKLGKIALEAQGDPDVLGVYAFVPPLKGVLR